MKFFHICSTKNWGEFMKGTVKQSTLARIFSIINVALAIAVLVSSLTLLKMFTNLNHEMKIKDELTSLSQQLTDAFDSQLDYAKLYVQTENPLYLKKYQEIVETKDLKAELVEKLKTYGLTENEEKNLNGALDVAGVIRLSYEKKGIDIIKELSATKSSSGNGELDEQYIRLRKSQASDSVFNQYYEDSRSYVYNYIQEFKKSINSRIDARINKYVFNTYVSIAVVCGSCVLMILMSIFYSVTIRKRIIQPIIEVSKVMQSIANGSLNVRLNIKEDSTEVGTLVASINRTTSLLGDYINDISRMLGAMAGKDYTVKPQYEYIGDFKEIQISFDKIISALEEVFSYIAHTGSEVSSGSEQSAKNAQEIARGATEQSSAVEELSATIEGVSNQIVATAQNAGEALSKAELAEAEITNCNTNMTQMLDAMNDINKSSGEISKIIKTIDDIAFQTNILALNAAVEAARAGAAGKGFAVVADEVRNLASKSAQAAKSTADLIENSLKSVGNGTKIANNTAKALLLAIEQTKQVKEYVNQIAEKTNEQTQSINQVTQGVKQISQVVQSNSALSEEAAATSEELSSQVQVLNSVLSSFKLNSLDNVKPEVTSKLEYSSEDASDDADDASRTDDDKYGQKELVITI
ncbi:MAG TPA: hypothetical protein DCP97_02800 [Ruminococcaceae bacterium]|nr:hypothetical protein [Oscillospiraceae bacterium]